MRRLHGAAPPVIHAMIMPFILLDLFVALKVNLGSRNSPLMLGTL